MRNQKSAVGGEAVFEGLEAPPKAIEGLGAELPALEKCYFMLMQK